MKWVAVQVARNLDFSCQPELCASIFGGREMASVLCFHIF